ncbi:MAG: 16S rRNA (guanine(527)-N(7))-methyltransferase RsmG [Bacteroidota bacterium]
MMDPLEFWTLCNANGILLTREQMETFERFHDELIYWNEKVNLISRKDIDNIWIRHFMHSLSIVKADIIQSKSTCLDVGCGGGFPGIPVGIARPDLSVTMVDSIAKKMKLTAMFADHTGQRNFKTIVSRMEDIAKDKSQQQRYDHIIARAVAPIISLIQWTKPLLKKDGSYILLKGGDLTSEILEAQQAFPSLIIKEYPINWIGVHWFTTEEKKIIHCYFQL